MIEWLQKPWPWYVAGPIIGLMVPVLLIAGNKNLGVSSSLRHICAACLPAKIPFFQYNWKKETWNLFFVAGILIGGYIAATLFTSPAPIEINEKLLTELQQYGITHHDTLVPTDIFNWASLFTARGFLLMVLGGFLVGFGTRYAGGCTSGHAIMGLSNLQWPSLVATCCFMAGGFIMSNLLLPIILKF
jgi:uncharacterized membrane protein YedE/YeeE